ncbi:MAG: cytosine methyltransferase [Myxococcales bacterium]|nr:cytosine methyltransferase [Myxococcales bacterium]
MGRPKIISLYTGAGGLDYGFEAAGFDTTVAVEMDASCCETLRANRDWAVIERDITQVPSAEILEAGRLKRGEASVLIGGPPCQPFSKAGYWHKGDSLRLDDPRANTLAAYLRVLQDTLPHAFLLENVEGLAYAGKDEGLRLLLDAIEAINRKTKSKYRPVFQVLNAADFGVPQMRRRVIMIAARDGSSFAFPTPTHADDGEQMLLPGQQPHRNAWDALGDVEPEAGEDLEMRGAWADLLPSIPEGSNYLFHTERGKGLPLFGWRRRYWSFLLKLAKNLPSWTIQAQPGPAIGPFHWDNRRLSMRELCRLQTFPDDVRIVGSRVSVQRQVGNAVPSLLAEVVAREVRSQLLGLKPLRGELKLLPPNRSPTPPPERVAAVPKKFRKLVGQHEAHPGTGKGYGAVERERELRA